MASKLPCTLVDDHLENLSTLKSLLLRTSIIDVTRVYTDPELFVQELKDNNSKAFFLDIEMPGINGIELTKKLKGKAVILVSGHAELAHHGFDLDIVDFVKKPVTEERLNQALTKLFSKFSMNRDHIFLPTDQGKVKFRFEDIIMISTEKVKDDRDKHIYLKGIAKPALVKNRTFPSILQELDERQFFRISKSIVVNRSHIEKIGKDNTLELTSIPGESKLSTEVGEQYVSLFKGWIDFE